jgi:hypothetical protein
MKFHTQIAAAALLCTAMAAQADAPPTDIADTSPSGTAMAVDLLFIRPLGVAATVVGTALFIVQLPFSITIGEPPAEPAKKLVVEPALFTFHRRLGQMN